MGSRRTITAMAVGATALALVTAGCSGSGTKSSSGGASGVPASGSATTAAVTPDTIANAFLAAWAAGDYTKAASYTDNPTAAGPRLAAVMGSLKPKSVQLTLGAEQPAATQAAPTASATGTATATAPAPATTTAPATHYAFSVVDTFDGGLAWSYPSVLGVVPAKDATSTPLVHWSSAVINPQLGGSANLKIAAPAVPVTDNQGNILSGTAHPTLTAVIKNLSTSIAPGTTPTSLQIVFVDANTDAQLAGSTPVQLGAQQSTVGLQLGTTIDSKIQTAAEQALVGRANSGMVVIKPSTGAILAMASNAPTNPSLAYQATRAPGSTFKVVTSAALLMAGVKTTDPAPCTPTATVGTRTYHNDKDLANGLTNATLLSAFEASCNTSFVNLTVKNLSSLTSLSDVASKYFGMNTPWDLGLGPATYGTSRKQQVPPAPGNENLAAEAFGQDSITMSPLTMASIAATVATGDFKQPILIPKQKQVTVTALPADVDTTLQTMMRGVVSDGTAVSMKGISATLGAKTGSAEPDKTSVTDSWMIVMDPQNDIAVAALVLNGGFGNVAAGPAIANMMKAAGLK